jgi:UDP-N-acetyl-D-mannosaminuronic acid dehydrogenase
MPMSLAELRGRIERREAVIGVIGLGYVGLPLACVFAQAGYQVIGLDIKADRVATINAGRSPIEGREPGLAELLAEVVGAGRLRATTQYAELAAADVVTINVETPVDDEHRPDYSALSAACRSLGPVLKEGALVIVESTVAPGTADRVVRPLLQEATGRRAGVGFYLGVCPERVMPGKLLANLRTMSRVCGGGTPETAETMVALYRQVVRASLDPADCLTAELVKTMENAYRDVQIAFANEMALLCKDLGADVWRVRELVNKSPHRDMHLPGPGVGGHCIPKDPWLLIANATPRFDGRLVKAARAVNDSMPLHVADLVVEALREAGRDIAGARIAVLGYSYLENSDDTRNTPSAPLVAALRAAGAEVVVHDPFVALYNGDWRQVVRGADAVVVMVAHDEYRGIDLAELKAMLRMPVVVDARRVFDAARVDGLIYRGVGR